MENGDLTHELKPMDVDFLGVSSLLPREYGNHTSISFCVSCERK